MVRRLLATALIAATTLVLPPAAPSVSADVYVRVAPPAMRYEVVPRARRGWVWVPGHWRWNGARYAWRGGHWVRARAGYRWGGARWVPYRNGYRYVPGGWVR